MKKNIRNAESVFLERFSINQDSPVNFNDPKEQEALGLNQVHYIEMVIFLLEKLCIQATQDDIQQLIWQLRHEGPFIRPPANYPKTGVPVIYPRQELYTRLLNGSLRRFRITYRGLCRIAELRDKLK